MAKSTKNTAERIRELVEPTVGSLALTLWDVEFVKEGSEWILRLTIDSPEGVSINDCEAVSRAVDPILDEADPIENSYRFEVSSPGVERTLRTAEHFAAFIGQKVEVKLYHAAEGEKEKTFNGVLKAYDPDNGDVTLAVGDAEKKITGDNVARVKTVYENI